MVQKLVKLVLFKGFVWIYWWWFVCNQNL